jgi:hypothetical protein
MTKQYLYVAHARSDRRIDKHHVYKVGYSTRPLDRIRTLGGSVSTVTYEPLLVLELPSAVKDIHVLAHRLVDPFVVYRHEGLQTKFLSIFGPEHQEGIKRRRELVMFGAHYTRSRVKALFRRIVASMCSPMGTYLCKDETCLSMGGVSYCGVCKKFLNSLVNCITYQSGVSKQAVGHKRSLEDADSLFVAMLEQTRNQKKRKWVGPGIGVFWILRPDIGVLKTGCHFLVARVQSRCTSKRTSRIQWWSCTSGDDLDPAAKFTADPDLDTLSWDGGGWQCSIRTRLYSRFMRIVDTDNINYYARQWRVPARRSE